MKGGKGGGVVMEGGKVMVSCIARATWVHAV